MDFQTQMQFGRFGAVALTGGGGNASSSGDFACFQCITEVELTSITAPGLSGVALSTVTLPVGFFVAVPFSAITVATGSLIAYKSKV